jgi:hypothetical protein
MYLRMAVSLGAIRQIIEVQVVSLSHVIMSL